MSQMDLFGPKAFRDLQADVERLRARLEEMYVELCTARAERDHMQRERDATTLELARLTIERDTLRQVADIANTFRRANGLAPPPQGAGWRDQDLKRLLGLVHPDHWSQGQLAEELAHELSLTINQMREGVV